MLEFVDKKKTIEATKLNMGDIVIAGFTKYLVICDGYGKNYFVAIPSFLIEMVVDNKPYKVPADKKFSIGDTLIEHNHNSVIKEIISEKDYKMTVEL